MKYRVVYQEPFIAIDEVEADGFEMDEHNNLILYTQDSMVKVIGKTPDKWTRSDLDKIIENGEMIYGEKKIVRVYRDWNSIEKGE